MSPKVCLPQSSPRTFRTISDGWAPSAQTVASSIAILALLEPKLEVLSEERKKLAVVVSPAATHGSSTCAEALALSTSLITSLSLKVSSLTFEVSKVFLI
jgi:hypothetical protein